MEIRDYDERFSKLTHDKDIELLRRTIEIAIRARQNGDHPFGCLLADENGRILMEQGNCQRTTRDCTGHAETTLARRASHEYDRDFLWNCSLYTSCEPCCMCTGAVYWSNIGRIVFAMTEAELLEETGQNTENPTLNCSSRTILATGQKPLVVVGPFPELTKEAARAHEGFWEEFKEG